MFHLVRGSVYLLIVLGVSFSFLYTGLVTIFTYIVLIFNMYIYIYIWDDVCLLHLSLHVLFLLYLYTHVSLCTQSLFPFHTWYLDEFCLSVSEKKSCESLSCRELFSCKVFQEFVVVIDLFCNTTSGYELSNLRLLSWLVFCCSFVTDFQMGRLLRTYFM